MALKVRDSMTQGVDTIAHSKTALDAARLMTRKKRGSLVVVKDEKAFGIITERDLVRKIIAKKKNPTKTKVSDFLSKPLVVIEADASLRDAADIMVKNAIRRLPVVDRGKLVGMLTTTDLAKELSEEGLWKEFEKAVIRAGEYGGYPYA